MMLKLDAICTGYGPIQVLFDFSLELQRGEVLCLLGRNGAGKTTALKAIMGLLPLSSGTVTLNGTPISTQPAHEVPKNGVAYVPQGRRLFTELTVEENLQIGLMTRCKKTETKEYVLGLFPRLRERLHQRAETLSGGEQQMLATARALCIEPSVLLLDEPTEGLQPSMIHLIRETIEVLRKRGTAILLVEQRIDAVLSLADRVAFIENGHGRDVVDVQTLKDDPTLLKKYVGI